MKARLVVKDVNNIDKMVKNVNQLKGRHIKVGVFGNEKHKDSDIEMVDLARIHEYGCDIQVTPKMRAWFAYNGYPMKPETTVIHIPERSFLRSGYDENIDSITKKIKEMMPDVIAAEVDPDMFMDAIGEEFAGLIQKKLKSIDSPPNTKMTLQRKDSTNPLQDSGQLVGAIRHEVD
ncbi:hypothetical protein NG54_03385 [Heyndrickxia ginsengihumi]|uniref:Uncharacterized protein n=1 Tax=Heyndrickxia ginsengihumi TaxID=363870 RepID=A0A0A6VFM6_9BACI|nr:hypothetical protein [Heyndrickxia ginsengihumi]KHD86371.1 hypothetical protein NG54_03385 [Heyndrickxia ginsengihumi]